MDKEIVRAIRVLEYVGPKDWVEFTLEKSFLQPGKPPDFIAPPRSMREIARSSIEPVESGDLEAAEATRKRYDPIFVDKEGKEEEKGGEPRTIMGDGSTY